jgi:hypothetical protein
MKTTLLTMLSQNRDLHYTKQEIKLNRKEDRKLNSHLNSSQAVVAHMHLPTSTWVLRVQNKMKEQILKFP